MAPGNDGMRGGEIGLQLDRLTKQGQRFVRILRHRSESVGKGAEIEVAGIEAVWPLCAARARSRLLDDWQST
jgi:hypothetical protein